MATDAQLKKLGVPPGAQIEIARRTMRDSFSKATILPGDEIATAPAVHGGKFVWLVEQTEANARKLKCRAAPSSCLGLPVAMWRRGKTKVDLGPDGAAETTAKIYENLAVHPFIYPEVVATPSGEKTVWKQVTKGKKRWRVTHVPTGLLVNFARKPGFDTEGEAKAFVEGLRRVAPSIFQIKSVADVAKVKRQDILKLYAAFAEEYGGVEAVSRTMREFGIFNYDELAQVVNGAHTAATKPKATKPKARTSTKPKPRTSTKPKPRTSTKPKPKATKPKKGIVLKVFETARGVVGVVYDCPITDKRCSTMLGTFDRRPTKAEAQPWLDEQIAKKRKQRKGKRS